MEEGVVTGRAARRAGLVAAVTEAVRAEGSAVSIDDLALAAQVPKSVLYNHFADKAGLLDAVSDAAADELCSRLRTASTHGPGPSIGWAAVEAFVAFAEAEPNLYDVLRPRADRLGSVGRAERIGRRIVASVSPGRSGDGSVVAPAAAGAMFAAVDGWQVRRSVDRDELIDQLLALLQSGLAVCPDPSSA